MKAAILYYSPAASAAHQVIILHPKSNPTRLFIRGEIVESEDLLTALNMAKPRDGEVVLNTVEVE